MKLPETYVDLNLLLKLNIPMKNLQYTITILSGQFTRIVGQISQTVQCVVSGQKVRAYHLKAKVVRDLSKLLPSRNVLRLVVTLFLVANNN